jgi:hypothetical protein
MADAMTPEEIQAWIKKHLANAPERDEQWYRETFNIYRLSRREALAARNEDQ